jgi:hypothetical protein
LQGDYAVTRATGDASAGDRNRNSVNAKKKVWKGKYSDELPERCLNLVDSNTRE